MTDWSS